MLIGPVPCLLQRCCRVTAFVRYAFQPELRLDGWVLLHALFAKHVLLRNSLCTSLAPLSRGAAQADLRRPFCVANYHWLGFDVDHTLIAYGAGLW